jgi:hypothetical protein
MVVITFIPFFMFYWRFIIGVNYCQHCASRETSHKSLAINPVGPQSPLQWPKGKMPPPEGANLGDFEEDDSNTGRGGHVALHHRLVLWGPISSLPLSLLWPWALLRAGRREVFLSATWGRNCDGSLRAWVWGWSTSLATSRRDGTHSWGVACFRMWVCELRQYMKKVFKAYLILIVVCVFAIPRSFPSLHLQGWILEVVSKCDQTHEHFTNPWWLQVC